jgi:hypothetical protein
LIDGNPIINNLTPVTVDCGPTAAGMVFVFARLLCDSVFNSHRCAQSTMVLLDSMFFFASRSVAFTHFANTTICGCSPSTCRYELRIGSAFAGNAHDSTMILLNSQAIGLIFCSMNRSIDRSRQRSAIPQRGLVRAQRRSQEHVLRQDVRRAFGAFLFCFRLRVS